MTNAEYIKTLDADELSILFDQIQVEAAEVALGHKSEPSNGCLCVSDWRDLLMREHDDGVYLFNGILTK